MKNFEVTSKEDGKKYWISRSVAVTGIIYSGELCRYNLIHNPESIKILLERRGPGCPDNVGKLALPCGYLDWDETAEQAMSREIYEELGLTIDPEEFHLCGTNTNPEDDARQNIVLMFLANYDKLVELETVKYISDSASHNTVERGGEKDEVSEVIVVSLDELYSKMTDEEFAFDHRERILSFFYPKPGCTKRKKN